MIARCVSNLELAKYKVLEVVAETTAPLRPIEDLLAEAPAIIDEDDRGTASNELVPSPIRKSAEISRQQEVHFSFFTVPIIGAYVHASSNFLSETTKS